MLVCE